MNSRGQYICLLKRKDRRAQALVICMWVLILLTLLALSAGHRVSLSLKLAGYQKNKLKSLYLAKAGLALAIKEIDNDATAEYDGIKDSWADNTSLFTKITLNNNPGEYATVNYKKTEGNAESIVYGALDEESKINLNTASKELLIALFEACDASAKEAEEISENTLIWRGTKEDSGNIYNELGYAAKKNIFSVNEEILLVKGITEGLHNKLKRLITVSGNKTPSTININTATEDTVKIFSRGIALELGLNTSVADNVTAKITAKRNPGLPFKNKEELNIEAAPGEDNLINTIKNRVSFKSDYFLIEVTGITGKIKSMISAVYNRKENKILSWHES